MCECWSSLLTGKDGVAPLVLVLGLAVGVGLVASMLFERVRR